MTTAANAVSAQTRPAAPAGGFQTEIQGLRTVAVLLVVVYHLWPHRLGGGYVGVDVFFVVSGFLITSHLYRDVLKNGKIDLLSFWARRIRRLLPLSFVVLLASLAIAVFAIPRTLWADTGRQIAASALYLQNWALATDSVAYSAEDNQPTLAQHFWSLSVEEQFYLVWPLLLAALFIVARRRRAVMASPRRVFVVGLVAVGVLSLATSVIMTNYSPAEAYFATPTRMWEFVAGALVAIGLGSRKLEGTAAHVAGWAGLLAILASALLYDETTPFPGFAALLPVVGTVLVLASKSAGGNSGSHYWLSRRPMVFLGDLSYGIYLWHWPLIVAAPFVLGDRWGWQAKIGVLVISVALAWASKVAVEDPFRRGRMIGTNRRAFVFMASGIAALVAAGVLLPTVSASRADGPSVAASSECYGPGALENMDACGGPSGVGVPDPTPEEVQAEQATHPFIDCQTPTNEPQNARCSLGAEQGTTKVGLVGDSYAARWVPTLDRVAKERGWNLETSLRSRCTPSTAERVPTSDAKRDQENALCVESVRQTAADWAQDEDLDIVFVAASQTNLSFRKGSDGGAADGFGWWEELAAAGKQVVVIAETPRLAEEAPTCLAVHGDRPDECSVSRDDAWPHTRHLTSALEKTSDPNIHQLDLTDRFCDAGRCYAQIGSVIAFSDAGHVSTAYAEALAPAFGRSLDALLETP